MAAPKSLSFGEQLQRYRRDRGLSQEELAERAGLSARGIRALEQGERRHPHKDTVRLLAEALGLSPGERASFEHAVSLAISGTVQGRAAPPVGGFLGAVPAAPIIARQDEVAHLLRVLDDVERRGGRLIMLAGEPGVGKTRLAQEVALATDTGGFLVASGRCYEVEQSVPYYPFLEALTRLHADTLPSIRATVPQTWPYLESLLPGRPRAVGTSDMGGQDAQQRLFWAVSGFVEAAAVTAPVALLLDDLHWADDSSLKLLQHLARQTRGSRVLLLGTYRDTEVGRLHPLQRTLHDLHREGLLEEVQVRRLDQEGTARLTAVLLGSTAVSNEFAQLVHEHTEGNPFFTQEVIRALVARGDVFRQDRGFDRQAIQEIQVPRSIRSAVGERVSRLSCRAQDVLHEASVLGQVFGFDDLCAMGKRTEEEVEEALDEAIGAVLVRATRGDEYAFNHALTQQTLYSELSPRMRRRLHAAVGDALEHLPESERRPRAAQIAWHFLHAGRAERALPFTMLAGDEAEAVYAHSEAEQHYRTALDLAQDPSDQRRAAEAMQKLGGILRRLARYDEALEMLEHAASLSGAVGDVAGEVRAMLEMGRVYHYRGRPEEGIARIQEAEAGLTRRFPTVKGSAVVADLYAALALDLWPMARYSEVLVAAEHAVTLARGEDYLRSRAVAMAVLGMALTMVGPLSEARRVLDEATTLLRFVGDTWWMANAVGNAGRALLDEGELSKGREYLERSLALIAPWHDRDEAAWTEGNLAEVSFLAGRWADARATYEGAIRMARDVHSQRHLSLVLVHLAEVCAAEGKWEEASGYIDEGLAIGETCSAVPALRKGQRLLAERDLEQGRALAAIDRLRPLLEVPERDWPRAFPPPILAEAYLELGDVGRAEELVRQRVQRFRGQNHRRALAVWLRVLGMILGRQHHWKESKQVFAEAVALARTMPYPYAEGRTLYEWAQVHLQCGEPERARNQMIEARATFRRLGARRDVQWTEQSLTNLFRPADPAP